MSLKPQAIPIQNEPEMGFVIGWERCLTADEKRFLVTVKEGKPEWPLLGLDGIDKMPAVQWKLKNVAKMDGTKHKDQVEKLKKKLGL